MELRQLRHFLAVADEEQQRQGRHELAFAVLAPDPQDQSPEVAEAFSVAPSDQKPDDDLLPFGKDERLASPAAFRVEEPGRPQRDDLVGQCCVKPVAWNRGCDQPGADRPFVCQPIRLRR